MPSHRRLHLQEDIGSQRVVTLRWGTPALDARDGAEYETRVLAIDEDGYSVPPEEPHELDAIYADEESAIAGHTAVVEELRG